MTNFYFPASRAHHATCMAIDFGMQFDKRAEQVRPLEGFLDSRHADYKIWLHPESLPLLEPQPGDLVFVDNQRGGEYWDEVKAIILPEDENYPYTGDGRPIMSMDGGDWDYTDRVRRIIQRGAIPFHWPEREVA